ncbi:MAG: sulfatase-like hydrolase/transferase [Chloroflexi bacterium]|nr:sulfatase-like hydrolase/transferase [Chloroflexota bacterium]
MNRRAFLQGTLALAAAGILPRWLASARPQSQVAGLPNILVLVFDTFSAHHASFLGYPRDTTPHMARFAEQSHVYHRHYATGNFTSPGTASLLTGVYPWSHRAFHINGLMQEPYADQNLFQAIAGKPYERVAFTHNSLVMLLLDQMAQHIDQYVPTRDLTLFDEMLAERLFSNDFAAAFLAERLLLPKDERVQSASLFLSLFDRARRERIIQATRQEYAETFPRGTPRADRHMRYFILEDAINWLIRYTTQAANPYLLYAHLYPPHGPYNARHEFIDTFAQDGFVPQPKERSIYGSEREEAVQRSRRNYDEYLLYADAEFGRLMTQLEVQGVLDNTIVVVTSDHGELFERGISGHITPVLYEPVIRVPLLIHLPGQTERQDVMTPTSIIDIMPTLLHLTEQPLPAWLQGQVLPGMGGPLADRGRALYALEAKNNRKIGPFTEATLALIKDQYKLIHYFGYEAGESWYELFDLVADPEERTNLYQTDDPLASGLRQELLTQLEVINAG